MSNIAEAGVLLGLTAFLVWGIRRCLRTGLATPGHYIRSSRKSEPLLFWLQLTIYALAAVASAVLASQHLMRALHEG